MCPTIRVDDEVYGWLQKQAVPFDDNPNSVLRRIANLDQQQPGASSVVSERRPVIRQRKDYSGRRNALASGPQLIKRWRIPARQARFHREGSWYEPLTRFPGALCDPNGYVIFDTEEEYKSCPQLKLGMKVNVSEGIWSITGYKRVKEPLTPSDSI